MYFAAGEAADWDDHFRGYVMIFWWFGDVVMRYLTLFVVVERDCEQSGRSSISKAVKDSAPQKKFEG